MADDFLLKLENISHLFQIRKGHGLNQVNLELYPGEVVALMGVNGSGKTTLLNTIAEKISPQKGKIYKGNKWKPPYHFQVASRFNMEASADVEEKRSFANWMNLAQFWDTELQNLSTGNFHKWQQMEHFLQLENTNLLLLDEAFAHMDRLGQATIMENLKSWTREKESSVLWSTHDLEFACRWSDRILFMQRGNIIFNGTPEEMLYRPPTIEVALAVDFGNLLVGYVKNQLFYANEGTLKLNLNTGDDVGTPDKPIAIYLLPEDLCESAEGMQFESNGTESGIKVKIKEHYHEHFKNIIETRSVITQRKIKLLRKSPREKNDDDKYNIDEELSLILNPKSYTHLIREV
ncbi:MAG: ABC transporter ATP-binding protein [Bacteriovoracaceae bacterium]|nr:ABC transporter ATP-binding protein [Bacteriovoracaceae bacterium]